MKINKKILSIPPYLSTKWEHITSLRLRGADLLVHLTDNEVVIIPNLKPEELEEIFNSHLLFMEQQEDLPKQALSSSKKSSSVETPKSPSHTESSKDPIFKIGLGSPLEELGPAMQHNPLLAGAPDLPREMLEKVSAISKIISPEDAILPKAEPHCNCPFCQIARAIEATSAVTIQSDSKEVIEEEVTEDELRFQEWDIIQSGEKLFNVVSRLDSKEQYSVYLGHPVGCTCGKEGCEHILAVLKS